MNNRWTFRYYVSTDGKSDVKDTYDEGTTQLRARFLSRISTMSVLGFGEWSSNNYCKSLQGPCSGLLEIRFKAENLQQRPLGYQSGPKEFTVLFWAREKGGKLHPRNACEKALKRKEEVLKNRNCSNGPWLPLE